MRLNHHASRVLALFVMTGSVVGWLPQATSIAHADPAACGAPSLTVTGITVTAEQNGPEFDGRADVTLTTSEPGGNLTASDSTGEIADDNDDPVTDGRSLRIDYFVPGGSGAGNAVSYTLTYTQDPYLCTNPAAVTQTLVVTYYSSGEGGEGTVNGTTVPGSTPETPIPAAPAPTITGTIRVGEAVTCAATVPAHDSVGYKWFVAGEQVATGKSFTIPASDYREALACGATGYNNARKPGEIGKTDPVDIAIGAPLKCWSPPGLDGETRSGGHLRISGHGSWTPKATSYKFQWYVGKKKIPGATGKKITVPKSAIGKHIFVRVTASAAGYQDGTLVVKSLKIPF